MANSVDPDQAAPLGAVWSGSTLYAGQSVLKLKIITGQLFSYHFMINKTSTPHWG